MPPLHRCLDRRAPTHTLRLVVALVCAVVGVSAGSAFAQPQPNIIVIMSDDVGYNEVGFNSALLGTPTQFLTPNLDALAGQSAVMRQGYAAAALCSMSRAGLLTGNYQQRLGFEENLANDLSQPWGYKGNETLLPDRLKALGYTTGMVGKWHNGYINGVNRPTDMGFDEFFGFLSGSRQYYGDGAPSNLMLRNNTVVEGQWRTQGNPATYDPVRGRYVTDAFGDEAVDYINRHANDPNPFYLHLAFTASHTPNGVKQQDYDLFSNIADTNDRTLAAMTYALDRNVGNVMNALQANGLASNTIVVYVNDNGGTSLNDNGPIRGFKGYTWEGGIRVPFTIKAPGLAPAVYDHPITMRDLVPTLVAAAGGTVPAAETAGVDVMPYLSGAQTGRPHDLLFWRGQEIWAVRKGDWKLARPNEPQISVLSLYNLATDPGELTNRVNQEPALVAELTREFTFWEATLKKPEFGSLGVNDKNNFDHFVFRNNVAPTVNWNGSNAWLQAGTQTSKTMLRGDAYANAILEFTTRDDANYTATNNMVRMSTFTYMLNEFRLTGNFAGGAPRTGTINGNAVILTKSLTGQLPRISLDASAGVGAATFAFNLNNELQLLDNVEIVGNGTQNFVINGVIKDYFAPRGVTKSGTSNVTLTANNTFGGNLVVAGGGLRIAGAGAAINGAAAVSVATPGTLTLAGGLIRTGAITLAQGAQFQFDSGTVEITAGGTDLGTSPLNIGVTGPATMSLAAGAGATSPTLRIGFNADSQLNLAAGAILATQGDAAIAFNNAGTPTGSAATVSGPGSMWTITGDLAVGQRGKAGLTVANGAYLQVLGAATLAAEPGSVATAVVGGAGALAHWSSGSMNVGGGPSAGGTATLTINANGIVESTGTLAIRAGDSVTLNGGELWAGQLDNSHGGAFNWQSGKVRVTDAGGVTIGPGGPLGASRTINATHPLEVAATTTLAAGGALTVNGGAFSTGLLQLDGGAFTAPDLFGVGGVRFTSGALTLNGGATGSLNVGPGGVTGAAGAAEVVLDAGEAWTISGTTTVSTDGALTVNGGSFQTGVLHLNGGRFAAASLAGIGSLDFDLGELAIMGDVTIAASGPLGATVDVAAGQTLDVGGNLFVGTAASPGALTIHTGGAVDVVGATTIAEMGSLTLAGGTLSTASLARAVGGSFTWTSGELSFTGGLTATAGAGLGAAITLNANHSLRVADLLTIASDGAVTLDGGALSVGDVTRMPGGSFSWQSGQLEITGAQGLLIAAGGLVGDTVVLSAGDGLSVTHNTSIAAGASLTVGGGTFATSVLDLLGGSFTAADLTGVDALSMSAGSIALTGPGGVTLGSDGTPATTPIVLQATDSLTVTGLTTLATGASLAVDGGAFTSGGLTLTGGSFSAATLAGVGPLDFQLGSLTLTQEEVTVGPGGQLGATVALSASRSLHVTGMTTIAATGSLSVADGAFTTGVLKLDGGTFDAADLTGVGAVQFLAGSMTLTGAAGATIGTGGVLPTTLTLDAGKALHVTATTTLATGGSLTVAGGAFTTGVLALNGGSFTAADLTGVSELSMSAGSMSLTGPGGVTLGSGGTTLSAPIVLHAADSLAVTGATTLMTGASLAVDGGTFTSGGLTLAGGSFSAATLAGVGPLDFQLGSLTLTQEDVTVGPGGQLGASVALSASRSLHVTGMTTIAATGSLGVADGAFTTGVLRLDGGAFDSADLAGVGAVEFLAGSMTLTGAAGATIGAGGVLPASLTLDAGKTLHVTATTYLTTGGSLAVAGGAFTTGVLAFNGGSFSAADLTGVSSVEFHSGSINLTGPGGVTIGPGTPLGPTVTLGAGASMDVDGTTTIASDGLLTVAGGAFTTDVLAISGGSYAAPDFTGLGAVQFGWGELKLTGDFTIGTGGVLEQALGGELVVGLGRRLTVAGTATLTAATRIGGGRLSVGNLVNPQLLDFDAGTLDLTNTNLIVGAGGLFGPLLAVRTGTQLNVAQATTVDAGSLVQMENFGKLTSATLVNNGEIVLDGLAAAVETSGVLTNAGTIRGTGRVGGPALNAAAGSVLVAGGERLRFLGPTFQNLGHVSAIGTMVAPAELEFAGAATNAASTGLITGASAKIRFEGGATNEGSIALTGGDNYVYGAVANDGEVVVTGGATATFYGDVVNDGVIRVSAVGATNSVAVFLGAVTGNGGTEGGGDIFFEGDLQPGEAFAAATFDNDVYFGALSTIGVDLAGTAAGVTYDQINVLGSLTLGGTLAVSLENGFIPQYGNIFEIISAVGGLTGTFNALSLPALTGNLAWQVAYDADSVSLLVRGEHAADFDVDGDVDGSDFLKWQRNLGTTSAASLVPGDANFDRLVNAADLPIWRTQFGTAPPALAAAKAVPEPTAAALAALACLLAPRPRFSPRLRRGVAPR